jgi:hypothetical protein
VNGNLTVFEIAAIAAERCKLAFLLMWTPYGFVHAEFCKVGYSDIEALREAQGADRMLRSRHVMIAKSAHRGKNATTQSTT